MPSLNADNRAAYNRLLADLQRANKELSDFYGPLEIPLWLRTPHKLLNGERAIDLLGTDRAQEVFAVIDQMRSGAHV